MYKQGLVELYNLMESDATLVKLTCHTKGAKSVANGARIIGNSIDLSQNGIPVPSLILGLGRRVQADNHSQPDNIVEWDISYRLWAEDVFQAFEIIEALENVVNSASLAGLNLIGLTMVEAEEVVLDPLAHRDFVTVGAIRVKLLKGV
jgi:hypothetical protein